MTAAPIRPLLLATLGLTLLGCAHRGGTLVTMTRLTVTPTPENNPGARWDEGRQDSRGDEGCVLLAALDFVAAPLGSIASAACSFAASEGEGSQWKAEDPDLFVTFGLDGTTYTSPVIADRASHDSSYSLYIPREVLRGTDLALSIYDLDGDGARQTTLIADHELGRRDLAGRLELSGEELGEPSLELLRLEFGRPASDQIVNHAMSANDGLVALADLDIPAGMLVEVRAAGSYRIGEWNDATLGPLGYPKGGPKDYNLPGKAFRRAKHGAAVALLQRDSAAQAVVVGECIRFVATSGGTLYVGVNDSDYRNNTGELSFEIRVTAPDAATWAAGGELACDD